MLNLSDPSLLRSQCFIDGEWVDADTNKTIAVLNPANLETITHIPRCGADETNRAVTAASVALKKWKRQTAAKRSEILFRWYHLMLEHQEDLALIMTTEQGKPLTEARGEIGYAASFLRWFGEEAKRTYGDVIPSPQVDRKIIVLREPIGVCAAITPWNFPAAMITRKVGPALAAGCTMVLKPAQQTPLSAFALAELATRAGVPKGVFNIVTGSATEIGAILTSHNDVRKLTFTGSTDIGKLLMRQCADTLKKVSLELGGNAPFIVFDDADLDAAVEGALISKYRNAGQTCVCTNRFLVQEKVYGAFAEKLGAAVESLRVGGGIEEGVQQGPLIDEAALQKVEELVADAVSKGAVIASGGRRHELGGTYYTPTILTNVTTKMRIAQEEIFGPVAPLYKFSSEEEAIKLANDTDFGLASYFYARDISRVWRVAEALEYGMVGINSGLISNEVAPFGGVKHSGLGREGSKYGIEDYMELKYLNMG